MSEQKSFFSTLPGILAASLPADDVIAMWKIAALAVITGSSAVTLRAPTRRKDKS
jgi:hypothetical protein